VKTRRLPNLTGLRAFEMAARESSLTKAARNLHVTQSAVSRAVRRLEQELGVRLFIRRANALQLTENGRQLAQELERAFDRIATLCAEMGSSRSDTELRIAVTPSFAAHWLVPRLSDFTAAHPDISISLMPEYSVPNPDGSNLDLSIQYGSEQDHPQGATRIVAERLFPVCSPGFLREFGKVSSVGALLKLPILISRVPRDWTLWLEANGHSYSGIRRAHRLFDYNIAMQAAIEGKGVLMGRELLVVEKMASGLLVNLFQDGVRVGLTGYYAIIAEKSATSEKVGKFLKWLDRRVKKETRPGS
jgi:LysR family glycine cleavage system transcriptional activator